MESCSRSLDAFDFKEDELPETVAAECVSDMSNPKHINNFLEKVAEGTVFLPNEFSNIKDATGNDQNCSNGVAMLLEGEDYATKRLSIFDAVPEINCESPDQQPQVRADKLNLGIMDTRCEDNSSPGAASPNGCNLSFGDLESQAHHESVGVVSDADECMSPKSRSTSSIVAEDVVPYNGLSSDHCFSLPEMGERDVPVAFRPDYILYRDIYSTDCELTFSSSCIEIKGSTAYGNLGNFRFQWGISDIIDIQSQWCARFEVAMVNIRLILKDALQGDNICGTSGIEELKFSVGDSNWYKKQEAVMSLDQRYKALWNAVLDDMDENGGAATGQTNVLFQRRYFPNFDNPFEDVVYPKGDFDAVSVSKRDVELLRPETFVNDTLIDFYIKYLKNKLQPEKRHRFHFFNSFFFRKLADLEKDPSSTLQGRAAFERVRKWTRKVNLFEKDYIFIPVNFNLHWSLIVICHPSEVAKFEGEDLQKSMKVPCILHMDSIRGNHTGLKSHVQSYLWEEWKEKQKEASEDIYARFLNLRFLSLELPQQQNLFDCGLFLLHYVELFLEKAPVYFNPFKITRFSKFLTPDWFPPAEASLKRVCIQRLIYDLIENCAREASPSNGVGNHCSSSSYHENANGYKNAAVFDSERCRASNGCHGNFLDSQVDQGIEMDLLPASSLTTSRYVCDSSMTSRECFEPGTAAVSFLPQYHDFNELKNDVSPAEEQMEEADIVCYPAAGETDFQPETYAFAYSSGDLKAEAACWGGPGNSLVVEANNPALLEDKIKQFTCPSAADDDETTMVEEEEEEEEALTLCLSGETITNATACPKNSPEKPCGVVHLIDNDSDSESEGKTPKKMRFTESL